MEVVIYDFSEDIIYYTDSCYFEIFSIIDFILLLVSAATMRKLMNENNYIRFAFFIFVAILLMIYFR